MPNPISEEYWLWWQCVNRGNGKKKGGVLLDYRCTSVCMWVWDGLKTLAGLFTTGVQAGPHGSTHAASRLKAWPGVGLWNALGQCTAADKTETYKIANFPQSSWSPYSTWCAFYPPWNGFPGRSGKLFFRRYILKLYEYYCKHYYSMWLFMTQGSNV